MGVGEEGKSVNEIPKVLSHHQVELLLVGKSSILAILLSNQSELHSFATSHVVHSDHQALFLNLLDSDQNVVTLLDFHALQVNDVLV